MTTGPTHVVTSEAPIVDTFGDSGTTSNTANTEVVEVAHKATTARELFDSTHDHVDRTNMDLMSRPTVVLSGAFTSTDTATTFANIDIVPFLAGTLLNSQKLNGYYAYRADVRLRLQVNGNRFQTGRYILAWCPDGGSSHIVGNDYYNLYHRGCLTQITQLPHVEIDIACDTEVELVIPYTNYFPSYQVCLNATTTNFSTGVVFLYPYEALSVPTGSTVADFVLWGNFENIETVGVAFPQSGLTMTKKRKGKSIATKELDSVKKGPISSVLGVISDIAGAVSVVPMLTEVALPVSWAASFLAGAAQAFGWSKPSDQSPVHRIKPHIQPFLCNVDAVDAGEVLGLSIENAVSVLPGFAGTDVDEMSIDHIKQIPAFVFKTSISTSDTTGTNIYGINVQPRNPVGIVGSLATYWAHPPVSYIAKAFKYWRGSLKYTFKFVKTEFHSGRYAVYFQPHDWNSGGAVTPPTNVFSSWYLKEIMDLREGNEYSITIPYLNNNLWCSTDYNAHIGSLFLTCIDPLVGPSSVSSTVTVLIEVSAGDDFEVAVPKLSVDVTACLATYQSGLTNMCKVNDSVLGNGTPNTHSTIATESSIGEKVVSLRALMKKFTVVNRYTGTNNWLLPAADVNTTFILTPTIDVRVDVAGGASLFKGDYFSYFGSMYAMFRGSIRAKYIGFGNNNLGTVFAQYPNGMLYSSTVVGSTTSTLTNVLFSETGNMTVNLNSSNAGVEVTAPFYNDNIATPVRAMLINGTISGASGNSLVNLPITAPEAPKNSLLFSISAANPNAMILRAIGEDASFGRFVSCPLTLAQ